MVETRWCGFIEPGFVSYENKGDGVWFLENEVIQKAIDTIIGENLTLDKSDFYSHGGERVGTILESRFDAEKGLFLVKVSVEDDVALENIDNGNLKVSSEYTVEESEGGGTRNGIHYDFKPLRITFKKLALTENPKYEISKFVNNNAGGNVVIKVIRKMFAKNNDGEEKKEPEIKKPVEEKKTIENSVVKVGDKEYDLEKLVEFYKSKKNAENSGYLELTDEIEIDGEKVSIEELIEAWEASEAEALAEEKKQEGIENNKIIIEGDGLPDGDPALIPCVKNNKGSRILGFKRKVENSNGAPFNQMSKMTREQHDAFIRKHF